MLDSSHGRGCLSQSLSLLTASCRERHGLAARSPWLPADQPTYPVVTRVTEPKLYFRRQSASCLLSDVGRGDVSTLRCVSTGLCSRSEEHTSELQSLRHLVCRLLLEKKKKKQHRSREISSSLRRAHCSRSIQL